jgi:uncharacterized protein
MMMLIENTENFVKETLSDDASGHDWWHIFRVRNIALHIQKTEAGDKRVIELAALLHDIADWKFHDGDEMIGAIKAASFLEEQGCDKDVITHVADIIKEISFKGAKVATPMSSVEGEIVQDADRLDAIGAIGIARCFAYGGHKGREMYNPDVKTEMHASFAAYKKNSGPTINHFYEKLLLLKDRMNTPTGISLAEKRHQYMQGFLQEFYSEWEIGL